MIHAVNVEQFYALSEGHAHETFSFNSAHLFCIPQIDLWSLDEEYQGLSTPVWKVLGSTQSTRTSDHNILPMKIPRPQQLYVGQVQSELTPPNFISTQLYSQD